MESSVTKEQLMSAEFVEGLFMEEDLTVRQANINKYALIAKSLGCKVQFDNMIKAYKQVIREERRRQKEEASNHAVQVVQNTYTLEIAKDEIESYKTGSWSVSDDGIMMQSGKNIIVASYYPVMITKILTDRNTGDEKMELTWKKNRAIRSLTALRNVVSSSSKIVELSRYGFPVTTETSRGLIRYLTDFEALNGIETMISSSKYGWAGKDFIPYTDDIFFDGAIGFKSLTESVHEEGDYEKWLDLVKEIRSSGRKEPMICLAASFGSVLLNPLKMLPFIVNMYGKTGSGKTVTLMLAASVWANPSERGYISESNSTLNALETKLDALNHLPLMVDDLSKLRSDDKTMLMNLIYGLCSGGGKNRLSRDGNMKYTPTWDNAIITNMERPLSNDSMRGGAMNRILDFEVEPGDIYKDGNHVVTVLSENFGFAGRVFVKAINEIGVQKIRDMVNSFRKQIKDEAERLGEEREDKQVTPLAVMLTADKISEEVIFMDGKRLDFDYCMQSVKTRKQISETERAYKHFVDVYHMNRIRFIDDSAVNYGEVWGKKMEGDYIAVIPSALEKIASVYNFDLKQFIKWCKDQDLLSCDSGRNQKNISFSGSAKRTRCYVIKIDDLPDESMVIHGDKDNEPEEPLPFYFP